MSTSPRSQSSSPDILGPPGDAQYLISSPMKPFTGRQSWMSPMVNRSQTPAKRARPRPRVSLSPAKSAHSIQFNDVILPGSPTMKFNGGRQRSLSPEKFQQEGNVSPWRIRLTLEATQDDEDENRASPSRKRLKPSTTTTMIPLKDERSPLKEKTPLRRRGRPLKSDTTTSPFPGEPGHTPRPGHTPGPGNTPGPGHTPGPLVGDSQTRKRGRPRGTPKPKQQDFQLLEDQPTPTVEYDQPFSPMDIIPATDTRPAREFSPMDTMASETGLGQHEYSPMDTMRSEAGLSYREFSPRDPTIREPSPGRELFSPTDSFAGSNAHASPLNLVGDADSEDGSWGNSDLSIADLHDPTQPITERLDNPRREYGRTSLETPVIGATEHHFLDDENIHSTPSKMPSPTRERAILSSRASHDTASPQSRTYPTPTPTSSLADEENQARQAGTVQHQRTEPRQAETGPVEDNEDAGDDFEEFDTIMESEGFTMISLDTLPSAKQHGFGSSAITNSGPKPKEVGERLRRKLPGTIEDLRNDSRARKSSSPVITDLTAGPSEKTSKHIPEIHTVHSTERQSVNYMNEFAYPELPSAPSPAKATIAPKKRTFTSLAKLVRVGLALQGPFNPQEDEWSGKSNVSHKRRRLERMFSTFNAETQRELRAAMGLGQELAMRRMIAEEEQAAAMAADREASRLEKERFEEEQEDQEDAHYNEFNEEEVEDQEQDQPFQHKTKAQEDYIQLSHSSPNNSLQQSPMSHQKAREARWQLDREAISRQAQMASNSQSVVYIDSDENESDNYGKSGFGYAHQPQRHRHIGFGFDEKPDDPEPEPVPKPARHVARHVEPEPEPEPSEDEDDGYDDIWQLEANDHSHVSHHLGHDDIQSQPEPVAAPLGNLPAPSAGKSSLNSSPYVASEHDYVARFGPSKVRELREQKVDLSALLAEEDTPNRARYYNGTSTPRSVLDRPSGIQHSPINGSALRGPVSRTPARIRLQPLSQSSPEVPTPPVAGPEFASLGGMASRVMQRSPSMERPAEAGHKKSHTSSGAFDEPESANLDSTSTPQLRQLNREEPGSSWFSKITSFTPQWLKAPARERSSSVSTIPEEPSDFEDEEELVGIKSAEELHGHLEDEPLSKQGSQSPTSHWRQPFQSPRMQDPLPSTEIEEPIYERSVSRDSLEKQMEPVSERSVSRGPSENEVAERVNRQDETSPGPRPLAVFGYFSDEHYIALRRIYRIAKRYPEQFEYYDAPGRAAIIGDWIWTSDGHHGVPITEMQFAIIDRFAQELARADIQYGGSGQIDWTEADLHQRLISIIIGEQIREERKAKANRGTSVDTWR
ncbi:hypothetical protein N7457_000539 [Penicillium paradoxum]|uniref:uncharacterized protein n=1 Tax=Penicillium paradoxum TaxID=176176 RepID=UPI002546BD59|nr:uncharacterized protein N7457_000539 [Penicillium paradoxum]KAJ5793940.1 hypothetical protein N7457_000539 [Penicillium paradoxum]